MGADSRSPRSDPRRGNTAGVDEVGRNAWEQLDAESSQAYDAFALYRSQGAHRSLRKVAHELDKSATLMSRWSARHRWMERVRAYDMWASQEVVADEVDAVRLMNKRHMAESHKLQQLVLTRIGAIRPEVLTPSDVARWLDIAVKIERKCMGLDDNGTTVSTEVNVAVATEAHIILATKLYPKAVSMLNDKQRAELDGYRAQLEAVAEHGQ